MRFIYCTCNVSVSERITSLLESNQVNNYQLVDHVIAKNIFGAPRFDTAIWPGYNVIIFMHFTDDEHAEKVLNLLRKFNKEDAFNNDELVSVVSWKTDTCFND